MDIFNLLTMIGGLSLFLYGMTTMGGGLSKMAGGKMESVLEKLTANKLMGVLLGTGVTAVIQSSSATTVMVVGFVNSGIMKLSQAVSVIMGANIGTTITSWILSLTGIEGSSVWIRLLKPSSFSPVLAAIGIILMMSNVEEKKKDIGNILVGFAVLMFGMETMSSSVSGLAGNPTFAGMMTRFSNPVLGMAAGAILTAIIQSSSASVGILQALCTSGAVHYSVALPIIMGQNIGTCVTSLISSVGASKNAKRAAMIHLYFNLIGTTIFMVVFYAINRLVQFSFLQEAAGVTGIAVIHSSFNIGATLLLFPFSDKLVKLAELTVRGGDENEDENMVRKEREIVIDERFLNNPSFAMEICRTRAREMAGVVMSAIALSLDVIIDYDKDKAREVKKLEELADRYEDVIGSYLVKLSGKDITTADSQSLSAMMQGLSDLERISDHAADIVESAEEIQKKKLKFTKGTMRELVVLRSAIKDVCTLSYDVFCDQDIEKAYHVEPLEEVIDTLIRTIKKNHIKRIQKGKSTMEMGFILEDVLTGLERVSDHCSNIAVDTITIGDNENNTHEYFKNFSKKDRQAFDEEYNRLIEEYSLKKSSQ